MKLKPGRAAVAAAFTVFLGVTLAAGGAQARAPSCALPHTWSEVAAREDANLYTIEAAPFGRAERGWAVYAPAVSLELGVPCPPGSPRFALALFAWQKARGLDPTGVMDAPTLDRFRLAWQDRRPFLALRAQNLCPDPPPRTELAGAAPHETAGKPVMLRKAALKAYRRMVAAARRRVPDLAADPQLLRIFSAFRDPDADAARCAAEGNCDGVARARCSAHRTGLAVDLMVGAAPGGTVDGTGDANRQAQSRGATYRWLLANAPRYGFVNYAFEPWHWEWTGEPVVRSWFQN